MSIRGGRGAWRWLPAAIGALLLAAIAQVSVRAQPPAPAAGAPAEELSGAVLYAKICQACHMAGGAGAVGAGRYPRLAGNPRSCQRDYVLALLERGNGGMPSFAALLSDRQRAAVTDYVCTRFGGSGAATQPHPATRRG